MMNHGSISFPQWKVALAKSSLSPQLQAAFVREILTSLKYCKRLHAPATAVLAKQDTSITSVDILSNVLGTSRSTS